MGPLQQGSKEARSMSELKDRLEGLLEALFMRILDNPSHATFGALGAFAMRSMRAWAGFRFCKLVNEKHIRHAIRKCASDHALVRFAPSV